MAPQSERAAAQRWTLQVGPNQLSTSRPSGARSGEHTQLTFHGLRHTAAGLMIEVGAHIEAIKQRMGHSSIRVTSDVYGSLLPAVDESVARGLDELLGGKRGLVEDSTASDEAGL